MTLEKNIIIMLCFLFSSEHICHPFTKIRYGYLH